MTDAAPTPQRFTMWCAGTHGHAPQEHIAGEFVLFSEYERDLAAAEARATELVAEAREKRLRGALQSISTNTCCDKCREAALVARAALEETEGE